MVGKYRLSTLGCKVNHYESEQVRSLLESLGLQPAADHDRPDVAVVNTCAVTSCAAAKSRQAVRRAARGGAAATIAIGCDAGAEPDALAAIAGVAGVIGHDADLLGQLRQVILGRCSSARPDRRPIPPRSANPHETGDESPAAGQPGATTTIYSISLPIAPVNLEPPTGAAKNRLEVQCRAFLKVQDGCDARCTYCIIPRLRPRLTWKPLETAVAEARALVAAGHREIVLTGVFLGAYGRDTARPPTQRNQSPAASAVCYGRRGDRAARSPLADLVAAIAQVNGLLRLRLSSLEPGDVDDDLLAVLSDHACCVPHLHLPLQSGSSAILRRMNRQYDAEAYLAMIERVRRRLDRPAITTDVMVGLPGETEEDFAATLDVARRVGFCKIHAFPFSPRPGTAAARWHRQFVPSAVVAARQDQLRRLEAELADRFVAQFAGETTRVIVEHVLPNGFVSGRSDRYFETVFHSPGSRPGDVATVVLNHGSFASLCTGH